jgi:heparan-sulfate lyase
MAVHCSPPAISGHDQPDNGTFELYAFGRWLMPDSGYYTYGHDPEARAWHRQTRVHNTLTLDGADSRVAGELLLWKSELAYDVLCVQNNGYESLAHRRTIWFVDRRFFVILDEAIGTADGTIDLHFQFSPGDVSVDTDRHTVTTAYEDANVLLSMPPNAPVTLETEPGWFAWKYGHREPRIAVRFRHAGPSPVCFLTVIVPFEGKDAPNVNVEGMDASPPGASRVSLQVETRGKVWELARDLDTAEALCRSR